MLARPVLVLSLLAISLGCTAGGVQPLAPPPSAAQRIAPQAVTASDYSPSLDLLALGYRDGTFEVRTPAPHHLYSRGKHEAAIANLAISKDGTRLASVDELGTLAISVFESGELRVLATDDRLRGAAGAAVGLSWDGASRRLAVAVGKLVRLIDVEEETSHEVELERDVTALAFTPDGKQLVAGGSRVQFLSLPSLKATQRVVLSGTARPAHVTDVRFSPDGRVLGVLMLGGVAFLDVASGRVDEQHFSKFDPVGVRFGADGRVLLFARQGLYHGPPAVREIEPAVHQLKGALTTVEFRKDGSLLFVGDAEDAELAALFE